MLSAAMWEPCGGTEHLLREHVPEGLEGPVVHLLVSGVGIRAMEGNPHED